MKPLIRILHLEDDRNDAELVKTMLDEASLACRITVLQDSDEFVKALEQDEYDVILADYRLPVFDGMSALQLVLDVCPDIPFIFVSGTMGEEAAIEALTQGATDYVLKQKMMRLVPAIERALNEAEGRRELKEAERERLENLRFFKSMDRINRVIQGADDLEKMMSDLLDIVLSIFDCDRAYLMYPCDPESPTWTIPMERTKPEYPGVLDLKIELPMDPQTAEIQRILLTSDGSVTFDLYTSPRLPKEVSKQFNVKTLNAMVIHPKTGSSWQFGIQQCSHVRKWTYEEKKLFEAIGNRLEDALTSLLIYRDLQESEGRYRRLADNATDVIWTMDMDRRFTYVSPSVHLLRGYSADEAMNQVMDQILTPESLEIALDSFYREREFLEQNGVTRPVMLELEQYCKDGTTIWTQSQTSFLTDSDGEAIGILGITRDITERKLVENALKRSEREKTILNQIANTFLITPEEDIYTEVLEIVLQVMKSKYGLFGYLKENGDLILPSLTKGIWDECQVTEKSIIFPQESWGNSLWGRSIRDKKSYFSDGPFHMPDGHILIDHFLTVPILYGDDTIGVISVADSQESYTEEDRDILKRIASYISPILNARLQRDQQEKKRRSAEETLRKLFHAVEQSPSSIVILDTAGNIEYVNPKFTEMTGYSQDDVLGKNPDILRTGELPDDVYKQLWKTITSGDDWHGEFQHRKKTGELFWEYISISPIFDTSNQITHFVGISEDITGRKRLEEQFLQAQKMEAVGQLAGGVAHDFNNMLVVIMGRTELALTQMDRAHPLYAELQEIRKAAGRSADLTRQLLAFARKQTIKPKTLDLNRTVEGITSILQRLIGENIDLSWLPGAGVWPVRMDPSQIDQVLTNLCVNARDAISGIGNITIQTGNISFDRIYCDNHAGFFPGDFVLLTVSDSGHGMDKKSLEKIFEPFFTTKEMGKGTGLGLATVYGIVKQNNGYINVYSEPGLGTTFKIYLPRDTDAITHIDEKGPEPLDVQGNESILLVEDDSGTLEIGKLILERFGYHVLSAGIPGEAIRIARKHAGEIDLLITDVVMPEMNGPDLVKTLAPFCPGIRHIFISGYPGNIISHHGIIKEGDNFIQKPFSIHTLSSKVREVLDNKSDYEDPEDRSFSEKGIPNSMEKP